MERRFGRWALLTLVLLLGSSAVGLVVNGVIKPRKPDYNQVYRSPSSPSYSTSINTNPTRDDLQPGGQPFQQPRKPSASEANELADRVERIQASCSSFVKGKSQDWQILAHFHPRRMAEEWARFGVYQFRSSSPDESTLSRDESTIRVAIVDRIPYAGDSFKPSNVEIVWIAECQPPGSDRVVLARHSVSSGGVRSTWYTRWWFCQEYGQWKLYDYEEHPHRLRANAVFAARHLAYYGETADRSDPKKSLAAVDGLIDATRDMMISGSWTPQRQEDPRQRQQYPLPLEAMRIAFRASGSESLAPAQRAARLKTALTAWAGTPVVQLMIAAESRDGEAITPYRTIGGNAIWANALEAAILLENGQRDEARALLRGALSANSGHPLLLDVLYDALTDEEKSEIGTLAARGATPSVALRRIIDRHIKDSMVIAVVDAYRELRPNDAESLLAQAVLDAAAGKLAAAAKMLEHAIDEDSTKTAAKRFVDLLKLRSPHSLDAVQKDPRIQSLLATK